MEEEIVADPIEEVTPEIEETPEVEEPQRPERTPETPEAKRARLQRELDRLDKKFPQQKEVKQTKQTKTGDFDYGELAYLTAKGIEADDEVSFIQAMIQNTGRTLKEVANDDYVQAKLKGMREAKSVEDAVPRGTKRSSTQARDSVDYWIAKGELPEDVALRRKVVNARIERETKRDVFGS